MYISKLGRFHFIPKSALVCWDKYKILFKYKNDLAFQFMHAKACLRNTYNQVFWHKVLFISVWNMKLGLLETLFDRNRKHCFAFILRNQLSQNWSNRFLKKCYLKSCKSCHLLPILMRNNGCGTVGTQIYVKNGRLQRDSNSDRWSREQARWPLDHHPGPNLLLILDWQALKCTLTVSSLKEEFWKFWIFF